MKRQAGLGKACMAALLATGILFAWPGVCPAGSLGMELYLQGDRYNQKGEFNKAVIFLTRAIDTGELKKADLAEAHLARALALRLGGEYQNALRDYDLALTEKPALKDDPYFLQARAKTYVKAGKLDLARADLEKALGVKVDFVPALNTRGVLHRLAGEYAEAEKLHEKALALAPHYWPAGLDLAWLWATCPEAKWQHPKQALKLAREVAKFNHNIWSVDVLAAAYASAGDYQKALSLCKRLEEHVASRRLGKLLPPIRERCASYGREKPWREAKP